MFIIKIVIGIISQSRAMIADSLNSAGDVFASFMTWLGSKISCVPNDDDHNYGHGKAEYIFSMLIGISMIIIALKLLFDSIFSIVNQNQLIFSWKLVVISIITIVTKFCLYLYTKHSYSKSSHLLIKSNMIDHRNDMALAFLTLIAIIFAKYNIYFIDGIVGIIISIWIMIAGIKLFHESYSVLMDEALNIETKKEILRIIKSYDDIKQIGNLYSIPIGYKYLVVVTIYVDGKMKTVKSHHIADIIEENIKKKFNIIEQVIIHVEPFAK